MSEKDGLDKALLRKFDIVRCVGKGAYGIVWKVIEKETGKIMALKRCFDAFHNSTDAQRTFREIMFLQELNGHENIVRLMNVLKADNHLDLYVLFDYMESDLQHVVSGGLLQPIHMEYITYQVLKAMKYIHSGGVLHRDLKPSNVLLNPNCHVRICDFGLARTGVLVRDGPKLDMTDHPLLTDYVATRWYRAPELLLGANMYAEGVDMWGVGCIVGEMLGGKPILKGRSTMDQIEKIIEMTGKPSEADLRPIYTHSNFARKMVESLGPVRQIPSSGVLFLIRSPPVAKHFVLTLLKFNPERRMSAETALEDAFVEKFHMQEPEPSCDKVIRMPIADSAKMKAADYRSQIYTFISQRKKMQQEEIRANGRIVSPPDSPRSTRATSKSPPYSSRLGSEASIDLEKSGKRDHDPRKTAGVAMAPWSHDGGAQAPPTTPS